MRGEPLQPKPKRVAGSPPPLGGYDADIIILSLNRLQETHEAIKSALRQRGGTFHVTVLDQGSEPKTLRGLSQAFSKSPYFALYVAGRNLGVAGGRNLAASLGHGHIVVALDNDAVLENDWVVARAHQTFLQNPNLGALGFNILALDGKRPDISSWGYPKSLLRLFKVRFDTTTFVGAGHAIRRVTWNAVGGYDTDFFFTWEEYDFCLAAIALNWRIAYDGRLAVIHKVSAEARVGWTARRMTYFVRNRLIIGRKWGQSWLSLTPRITGYLIKARLHGCFSAALLGVKAAVATPIPNQRHMPKAMRLYIYKNETRHRGSWLHRLRFELLGRIQT
jgi:GT2 family glycosyltransferase